MLQYHSSMTTNHLKLWSWAIYKELTYQLNFYTFLILLSPKFVLFYKIRECICTYSDKNAGRILQKGDNVETFDSFAGPEFHQKIALRPKTFIPAAVNLSVEKTSQCFLIRAPLITTQQVLQTIQLFKVCLLE